LSGWLIRKANELAERLTELYDEQALSFYDAQALVFKMACRTKMPTPWKCHPEPEHRQVHKAIHHMSATVKDRLRRSFGDKKRHVRNVLTTARQVTGDAFSG
jgi:hypothetical protein